jgi:hypothetical protein
MRTLKAVPKARMRRGKLCHGMRIASSPQGQWSELPFLERNEAVATVLGEFPSQDHLGITAVSGPR